MLRALALLALAAIGCVGETQYVEAPGQDDAWIRDAASEAWAAVGVETPADYTLLFLAPETLMDACHRGDLPAGTQLGGCLAASDVVLLNGDNSPEQQVQNLLHELGHAVRGGHAHLDCGAEANAGRAFGSDVMCLSGAGPGGMPTERDAAFVTR